MFPCKLPFPSPRKISTGCSDTPRPAAKDRSRRHGPHLKECPERGSSKPVSRQGSIWDGADSVEEALRSMKLYPGVSADLNAPPWLRILRPGWGSAVFKFAER